MLDVLKTEQDRKARFGHLMRALRSGQIFNHKVLVSYLDIDLGYSKKVKSVIKSLTVDSVELKTGEILTIISIFLIEF